MIDRKLLRSNVTVGTTFLGISTCLSDPGSRSRGPLFGFVEFQ